MNGLFAWADAHSAFIGIIMCVLFGACAVILSVDSVRRMRRDKKVKSMKSSIKRLKAESYLKSVEIKSLKADLFAAKQDGKIAVRKKQEEIDRLTTRIMQLEQDKKQLTKWGK